jgi:hypothetical protein
MRETNIRGNETINKVKAGFITRKTTNIINRTRAAGITTLFRLVILRSTFPLLYVPLTSVMYSSLFLLLIGF